MHVVSSAINAYCPDLRHKWYCSPTAALEHQDVSVIACINMLDNVPFHKDASSLLDSLAAIAVDPKTDWEAMSFLEPYIQFNFQEEDHYQSTRLLRSNTGSQDKEQGGSQDKVQGGSEDSGQGGSQDVRNPTSTITVETHPHLYDVYTANMTKKRATSLQWMLLRQGDGRTCVQDDDIHRLDSSRAEHGYPGYSGTYTDITQVPLYLWSPAQIGPASHPCFDCDKLLGKRPLKPSRDESVSNAERLAASHQQLLTQPSTDLCKTPGVLLSYLCTASSTAAAMLNMQTHQHGQDVESCFEMSSKSLHASLRQHGYAFDVDSPQDIENIQPQSTPQDYLDLSLSHDGDLTGTYTMSSDAHSAWWIGNASARGMLSATHLDHLPGSATAGYHAICVTNEGWALSTYMQNGHCRACAVRFRPALQVSLKEDATGEDILEAVRSTEVYVSDSMSKKSTASFDDLMHVTLTLHKLGIHSPQLQHGILFGRLKVAPGSYQGSSNTCPLESAAFCFHLHHMILQKKPLPADKVFLDLKALSRDSGSSQLNRKAVAKALGASMSWTSSQLKMAK